MTRIFGTVDSTGLYTAPATTPTSAVTVSATKSTNTSITASASVNVVTSGTVTATANSQVALYTIAPPVAAGVSVQFGTDTTYGLTTWSQTSGGDGASQSIFVAGMKAETVYHMRASLQMPDGTTINDSDHTFTTGTLPSKLIQPSLSQRPPPDLLLNPEYNCSICSISAVLPLR